VRPYRSRLPEWCEIDEPFPDPDHEFVLLLDLVALPLTALVITLPFLAELPVAVARGLMGSTRWVEAFATRSEAWSTATGPGSALAFQQGW